ncbi:MAG: hypothetical protein E6J66_11925 [Deltaproteobacteria bacterium]|nr:MAG: hypothetical protein E6J66_11925 [Deltaproteobacteria bacterium]
MAVQEENFACGYVSASRRRSSPTSGEELGSIRKRNPAPRVSRRARALFAVAWRKSRHALG